MKTFDLTEAPEYLRHWSVDQVAECLDGIDDEVYNELWKCLVEAEKACTDKPRGGDGSDGTTEEPIVSEGEYGDDLVAAWPKLSSKAKLQIHEAAAKREAKWDAM
jgi:hypothetical protein